MMTPPGSLPGINSLATTPTIKPTMMVQMIPITPPIVTLSPNEGRICLILYSRLFAGGVWLFAGGVWLNAGSVWLFAGGA